MAEKKRSCERTSYEVRERWNKANYSQLAFHLPKEDAAAFKEKCKATGIPQAQIFKDAVYAFLEQEQ